MAMSHEEYAELVREHEWMKQNQPTVAKRTIEFVQKFRDHCVAANGPEPQFCCKEETDAHRHQ